jgi:hypothetical protein
VFGVVRGSLDKNPTTKHTKHTKQKAEVNLISSDSVSGNFVQKDAAAVEKITHSVQKKTIAVENEIPEKIS